MLKELKISNIILIEQAHIPFEKGFTVLSGETGAGKSAIMEALKLVLGGRTDTDLIRHGADKGSIIAVFDLENIPKAKAFLLDKGIDSEDPDLLILQREITAAGKTKCAINHQPVQLSVIRDLAEHLLELVSQHANHKLFNLEQHRTILDLFGEYQPLRQEYDTAWQQHQHLLNELHRLKNAVPGSVREFENCEREIKEIDEVNLKEGEEEELFESYTLLASSKDRQTAAQEIIQALEGSSTLLGRARNAVNSLNAIDPKFSEELLLFPQILVELEELGHTLRRYEGKLDSNPATLDALHKRLTIIERFKRKYGDTIDKVKDYQTAQKERLNYLKNLEAMLEETSEAYQKNLSTVKALADRLTNERKKCALDFSSQMSLHLHSLNMKDAKFHIQLSPIPLSPLGQDKVEFFLHTNVGEKLIALKDSASGGEIARVLLALHVLLAGKEKIGTLIFDEIDANIGGTTASLMGEGLKALGKSLQILSITHFPQVAKCAEHHLQIAKSAINGRTVSQVTYLASDAREEELARMSGRTLGPTCSA